MTLDLTVAIPSHNDNGHLTRLLSHLAALKFTRSIIVVDDGSLPAPDHDTLIKASGLAPAQLTLLRQPQVAGAGAARNRALLHTTTKHLLFMDADDLPTRELRALCRSLAQAGEFDFCMFQHHDSRMGQSGQWGQMAFDQSLWDKTELNHRNLSEVSTTDAACLAQTANYPWNKIYRTDFLHAHRLRCSDTLVHNDIALHWKSFLRAGRILSSARIGVTHFVTPGGDRLTNRLGAERLRVFEPLEEIALEISVENTQKSPYALAFFGFVLGLLCWVNESLDPSLRSELAQRSTAFFNRYLSRSMRTQLKQQRPDDWQRAAKLFQLTV